MISLCPVGVSISGRTKSGLITPMSSTTARGSDASTLADMRGSAVKRLVIRTSGDADTVVVEVSDTGSGMSADTLKRVFEPFFTTKPAGEGTGLGLSVSYGIVEAHNGTISVESAPGRGTTFRIVLPVPRASSTVRGRTA